MDQLKPSSKTGLHYNRKCVAWKWLMFSRKLVYTYEEVCMSKNDCFKLKTDLRKEQYFSLTKDISYNAQTERTILNIQDFKIRRENFILLYSITDVILSDDLFSTVQKDSVERTNMNSLIIVSFLGIFLFLRFTKRIETQN